MAVETPMRLTVEEYLAWEETNFEKHEYIDGEVRCVAGANRKHNQIAMNTGSSLWQQLEDSNCMVLSSDMRAKVGDTRYVYPDLTVVCDEALFERASEVVLINPLLVIEITSLSTIETDRGEKKGFYFEVPSIQAYLIIDQHRVCAELSTRSEAGWQTDSYENLDDIIPLEALSCELPLSQVYRGIVIDRTED